jgi:hypothetical protein
MDRSTTDRPSNLESRTNFAFRIQQNTVPLRMYCSTTVQVVESPRIDQNCSKYILPEYCIHRQLVSIIPEHAPSSGPNRI